MNRFKSAVLAIGLASVAPMCVADTLAVGVAMTDDDSVRALAASAEAEIVAIDLETREVSLKLSDGKVITFKSQERYTRLEDVTVGDTLVTEYMKSLVSELRAPTATEMASPWMETETQVTPATRTGNPVIGAARQVRAVCTIEAADREAGMVRVKDARGQSHTVTGVDPSRFEGVSLGDTVVVTFTEAIALAVVPAGGES